jgi:hypothetical protein
MRRKHLIISVAVLILLLPLWMWMLWLLSPKKKMVIAIVDKTVVNKTGQEHLSLTWILNYEKFTKTRSKSYQSGDDYFGFFPKQKEQYRVKGLERFTSSQLDQLSKDCDMAYYTDTYGVNINEWYTTKNNSQRSGVIYGGMSQQDIDFLQRLKNRHKLIISEFNTIGSPTADEVRIQFETMFGLKWSGWVCRFYESLDTTVNKQIPDWIILNYRNKNKGTWPFTKAGLVFVSNKEDVVVLEDRIHLNNPVPYIDVQTYGKDSLGLPDHINYPFWFDVMLPDTATNKIIATFNLNLKPSGAEELMRNNIPLNIPAICMHKGKDYQFYYFSGNFSNNPLSFSSSYFKGISFFKKLFLKERDEHERGSFFWNFYKPMLTHILNSYYSKR